MQWLSLACAAHRLQNALHDAPDRKSFSNLLARARHLVGHFKHSALKVDMLESKEKLIGTKTVKHLIQDCPTRWNSAFRMLERLVELKVPLQLVLPDMPEKDRRQLDLTPDNWATCEQLVDFLRSGDQVTTSLGGEKYSTLSWLLHLLTALRSRCETGRHEGDDDDDDDRSLLVSSLQERFADHLAQRF